MPKKPDFKDEIDAVILEPFEKLSWVHPVTGEELTGMELVEYAYSREGRRLFGAELPNPTPIDPPIGFVPAEPIHEQIKRMVLREMAAQQGLSEDDSLEELDDFDVGDDYDPESPWEEQFWPESHWPPAGTVPEEPPVETPSKTPPEAPPEAPKPPPTPPAPPAK